LKNDPVYANKLREDDVLSSLSVTKAEVKQAESTQRERELKNMSFQEIFDRMEPAHQQVLAKRHGLRPDQVRKMFEDPKWTVPRAK